MSISLNRPAIGVTGWGGAVDDNWVTIQDTVNNDLIKADVLANRPTADASNAGFLFFATDDAGGTLYRSDGSSWIQVASPVTPPVPPPVSVPYFGSLNLSSGVGSASVPPGSTFAVATYSSLSGTPGFLQCQQDGIGNLTVTSFDASGSVNTADSSTVFYSGI